VVGLAGQPGEGNVFESLRKGGFIGDDTFGAPPARPPPPRPHAPAPAPAPAPLAHAWGFRIHSAHIQGARRWRPSARVPRLLPRAGMCLHKGTRSNGTFTVGGLDPRLYEGEFAWAKNVGGGGLYEMPLAGITVGGKPVKVRARPPSATPRAVDSDSGPAR
jgi:hypothetical protein